MKNEIEVIDNFLPTYQFKSLKNILFSTHFPWYFNNCIIEKDKGKKYQLFHVLYDLKKEYNGRTQKFGELEPIINLIGQKLNITRLYRIKANLRPKSFFNRVGGYHVDGYKCSHTAIFYINTNNGYTEFKNGTKVKSVENRMVVFPSNLELQGYTCCDQLRRVVVNFNYDKLRMVI